MSLFQSLALTSAQNGFAIVFGDVTPASADINQETGLSSVQFGGVSLREPPTTNHTISIANMDAANPTILRIRSFKPTAAGDTTPIAATTPVKVTWWAVGTK